MLFLPAVVGAQTPSAVLTGKYTGYRQVSATSQQLVGAGFGIQVSFGSSVPASTTVQLRAPSGMLTSLARLSDVEFELTREFPEMASLNAVFPDGIYSVLVGAVATVTVSINSAMAPVLITNFDELQAAPPIVEIRWQPIPGAVNGDLLSVTINDASGSEIFSTPNGFLAGQTSASANALPPAQPLTGMLLYGKATTTFANGGATVVSRITGFAVEFPLMRIEPKPSIFEHPRSRVAMVGETVQFTVRTAHGTSQRWKRNGLTLPQNGTTLTINRVQGSDAGTYTFEVENSAGTLASEAAVLLVQPQMTLSTFAGQTSRSGSDDGPIGSALFRQVRQMACDSTGALYVIDGHAIRKIAGGMVTTVAGSSTQSGHIDGPGATSRFNQPLGITVDAEGNVYIADTLNAAIRKITPTGDVSTVPAPLMVYRGVVVDAAGNLYVRTEMSVMRITRAGVVSTLHQRATTTLLDTPLPIAIDRAGNVFVSYGTDILKIAPNGDASPFAGGPPSRSEKTGGLTGDVYFAYVSALGVDAAGNVYVSGGWKIWKITPSRATAAVAESYTLNGMAVDANGTLYGAQGYYTSTIIRGVLTQHSTDPRVAMIAPPTPQTVAFGDTTALQVTATGPDLSYQWLRDDVTVPGATGPVLLVRDVTQTADYTVVVGNGIGATVSAPARVTPVVTSAPGRLINLSLRARAGSGAQTLIMGFALAGSNTEAGDRTLLLRGIGPGLSNFGVGSVLADPRLDVVDNVGTTFATNDDWGNDRSIADSAAAVGAFPLAAGAKDAALLVTLPARTYTVQVLGADSANGVALAEVYDAKRSSDVGDVRLINVSARTVAGTGDDTLTAGLVIGGVTAKAVLIRAVGPGLGAFGVTGVLRNPKLTLYSGQNKIAENDDWADSLTSDLFDSVGAFRLQPFSPDAALIATLAPGPYTVQVTGMPAEGMSNASAMSGVALVEVYEIK